MDEMITDTSLTVEDDLSEEQEEIEGVTEENAEATEESEPDIGEMLGEELSQLKETFPELAGVSDITEIKNPLRYAALRDLGLSPCEAYLAARGPVRTSDNRSHLSSSAPKVTGRGASMPKDELIRMRELFYGMSDSEIQRLWRRVNN